MFVAPWIAAVVAAPAAASIDFDTHVVPVLTKSGCNAGACHGAAAGRGGFHLSLLGGDSDADYWAIVREFEGRRVNLARPSESLLLRKPTGQLEHGGGIVLYDDDPGTQRIVSWLTAGAPRGTQRKLIRLEVVPQTQTVERTGIAVPLAVTARFDDGSTEDVSEWTVFTSADPASLELRVKPDSTTEAIVRRGGQHTVIARYLDRVVPISFYCPLSDEPIDLSHEPVENVIDQQIVHMLERLRLPTSPQADDAMYCRRVHLDLTGTLPNPAKVESFLANGSPDKRDRLVDELLASDDFADYWTLQFARWLRVHSLPGDSSGTEAYTEWLRQCIATNVPLDVMARELITATGDSHVVGPANFARTARDARDQAELASQFFMGARLACANCHNHPLDRWTQDDYHGLAAVFARLERGRVVTLRARGGVTNLRTGQPAVPRIPGVRDLPTDVDGRLELANWLTESDDRHFARAIINRLWQSMFGRGLVEPVDDLRDTNPATHPELLARLADDFVAHDYDLRHALRHIARSRAYGRSYQVVEGNASDDRFYARAYWRPLSPEVLADAFAEVTGIADAYPGHPAGTRAIQIVDPLVPSTALDVLGRCSRTDNCQGAASGGGLTSKLHLMNGDLLNRKLASQQSRLHEAILAGKSNSEIIDEFYLRALGRHPRDEELLHWEEQLAYQDPDQRMELLQDFLWSLLNGREFSTNH